ncbi:hypothetical protein HPB52_021177 [Rhipicephalus sanguineus]|uniref:Uncharacterized protein n=1 Tax=Rhipicephalus sanguineus TaxID=34632 RepID=A0A9D4PED8_RHISA|nr:hypothetical protein HPB52_009830 [Rhipicephalus sanguineus]KAH7936261.1 hypothetical protein HPB52_021177 [Rhipicephalus sanguineus]
MPLPLSRWIFAVRCSRDNLPSLWITEGQPGASLSVSSPTLSRPSYCSYLDNNQQCWCAGGLGVPPSLAATSPPGHIRCTLSRNRSTAASYRTAIQRSSGPHTPLRKTPHPVPSVWPARNPPPKAPKRPTPPSVPP